jgi:Ca2+-binding RTX toxin-like protein
MAVQHGIGAEAAGMELHQVDPATHQYDASGESAGSVILGSTGSDTVQGSAHGDIIYGGGGNDIIDGGAGNDIIYAGAGNNIIRGGEGNDVMYSGSGSDTFLWLADDLGAVNAPAQDTIHGFQLNSDTICFKDVFGAQGSIETLLDSAAVDSVTRTVSFAAENGTSFEAKFASDSQLMLTLKDDEGREMQSITVNAAEGTSFPDLGDPLNEELARQILQQMIKDGTS